MPDSALSHGPESFGLVTITFTEPVCGVDHERCNLPCQRKTAKLKIWRLLPSCQLCCAVTSYTVYIVKINVQLAEADSLCSSAKLCGGIDLLVHCNPNSVSGLSVRAAYQDENRL